MFRLVLSRLVSPREDAWYALPSNDNDMGDLRYDLTIRRLLTSGFGSFCYRHVL